MQEVDFAGKWRHLDKFLRNREVKAQEEADLFEIWDAEDVKQDHDEVVQIYREVCRLYLTGERKERARIRNFFAIHNLWRDLVGFANYSVRQFEAGGEAAWLDLAIVAYSIENNKRVDFRDTQRGLISINEAARKKGVLLIHSLSTFNEGLEDGVVAPARKASKNADLARARTYCIWAAILGILGLVVNHMEAVENGKVWPLVVGLVPLMLPLVIGGIFDPRVVLALIALSRHGGGGYPASRLVWGYILVLLGILLAGFLAFGVYRL